MKTTKKSVRPVVISYTDWDSFIQMDKKQWKRVERLLGRLGIYIKEISRTKAK